MENDQYRSLEKRLITVEHRISLILALLDADALRRVRELRGLKCPISERSNGGEGESED